MNTLPSFSFCSSSWRLSTYSLLRNDSSVSACLIVRLTASISRSRSSRFCLSTVFFNCSRLKGNTSSLLQHTIKCNFNTSSRSYVDFNKLYVYSLKRENFTQGRTLLGGGGGGVRGQLTPTPEFLRLKKKNCFVVAKNSHICFIKKEYCTPPPPPPLGFCLGYGRVTTVNK